MENFVFGHSALMQATKSVFSTLTNYAFTMLTCSMMLSLTLLVLAFRIQTTTRTFGLIFIIFIGTGLLLWLLMRLLSEVGDEYVRLLLLYSGAQSQDHYAAIYTLFEYLKDESIMMQHCFVLLGEVITSQTLQRTLVIIMFVFFVGSGLLPSMIANTNTN